MASASFWDNVWSKMLDDKQDTIKDGGAKDRIIATVLRWAKTYSSIKVSLNKAKFIKKKEDKIAG